MTTSFRVQSSPTHHCDTQLDDAGVPMLKDLCKQCRAHYAKHNKAVERAMEARRDRKLAAAGFRVGITPAPAPAPAPQKSLRSDKPASKSAASPRPAASKSKRRIKWKSTSGAAHWGYESGIKDNQPEIDFLFVEPTNTPSDPVSINESKEESAMPTVYDGETGRPLNTSVARAAASPDSLHRTLNAIDSEDLKSPHLQVCVVDYLRIERRKMSTCEREKEREGNIEYILKSKSLRRKFSRPALAALSTEQLEGLTEHVAEELAATAQIMALHGPGVAAKYLHQIDPWKFALLKLNVASPCECVGGWETALKNSKQ